MKLPQPPKPSATITLISHQPSTSSQNPPQQKDYDLVNAMMMVSIF
jgi:hypothetical protein